MSPALNKVQRLAIAAQTATTLRNARERRPIKLVDAEGRVVGTIDSLTLAEKLHARAGIELDVIDDARPTHAQCKCGRWFEQPTAGPRLSICRPCRRHPCSAKLKSGAPCRALATETSSTRARLGRARAYCRRHGDHSRWHQVDA
jgi:hypothetical protein